MFLKGGNLRFVHNPLVAIHKELGRGVKNQRRARPEVTLYYSVGVFNETEGKSSFNMFTLTA